MSMLAKLVAPARIARLAQSKRKRNTGEGETRRHRVSKRVSAQSQRGQTRLADDGFKVSTKLRHEHNMATHAEPMKAVRLISLALTLVAASSLGGEIYGTIKENGKPIGKDIAVTIEIAGKSYSKPTDEFGSYRIFVAESGKGTAKLAFKEQTISGEIESYSTPVRFDLVIENKDGHYILRRQ